MVAMHVSLAGVRAVNGQDAAAKAETMEFEAPSYYVDQVKRDNHVQRQKDKFVESAIDNPDLAYPLEMGFVLTLYKSDESIAFVGETTSSNSENMVVALKELFNKAYDFVDWHINAWVDMDTHLHSTSKVTVALVKHALITNAALLGGRNGAYYMMRGLVNPKHTHVMDIGVEEMEALRQPGKFPHLPSMARLDNRTEEYQRWLAWYVHNRAALHGLRPIG